MAYTQTDLTNIKKAIATGTLTVEVDGQKVTYRSLAELERIKSMIEREVSPSTVPRRTTVASYRRG
jgi:hypothetical protein